MMKWFYVFNFTLKLSFNYILNEFFTGIYRLTTLIGVLVVGLQAENSQYLLSYVMTGSIFFAMTEPFISWELGEKIKSGQLVKDLILPSSFFVVHSVKALARCIYIFVSYLPILLFTFIFFWKYLVFDLAKIWIFIPWFFIALGIRYFFDILAASISFWTVEFSGPVYMIFNATMLLAGAIFPLSYLPASLQWLKYAPPAYILDQPMQTYLGIYDLNQSLFAFLQGVIWLFLMYVFTKFCFNLGLKKYESVGL